MSVPLIIFFLLSSSRELTRLRGDGRLGHEGDLRQNSRDSGRSRICEAVPRVPAQEQQDGHAHFKTYEGKEKVSLHPMAESEANRSCRTHWTQGSQSITQR